MEKYISTVIIGFVFICIGVTYFILEAMSYEYVDSLPLSVSIAKQTYTYDLDEEYLYVNGGKEPAKVVSDEEIPVGTAKVEVNYYDEVNNLTVEKTTVVRGKAIAFQTNFRVTSPQYFYEFTLDSLRDKKIYNYELFDDVAVRVSVNPIDIKYIKDFDEVSNDNFYIKDETVICAEALEEIARDNEYIYYLSCIKSNTVYLIYDSGIKISVRMALSTGKVNIYDLLEAGLDVYKEPITTDNND